jgi:predicted nucleic acid-binding protein
MARGVLIDTSAWVESMREAGDERVRSLVQAAVRSGRACLCDFVLLELWNGIGGESERRWLAKLERRLETVPSDAHVWSEARRLAEETRRRGLTIPASDLLIAACARAHGLDLLQRDAHFDRLAAAVGERP